MPVISSAQNYLETQGAVFQVMACPARENLIQMAQAAALPPGKVLRAALLESATGLLMAILPCDRILDVEVLSARLGCDIWPAPGHAIAQLIPDADPRYLPALPHAYSVQAILDDSIASLDRFWLAAGDDSTLLGFESAMAGVIWRDVWHGSFARQRARLFRDDLDNDATASASQPNWPTAVQLRHRIQALNELPPMPAMAQQLLRLRLNPQASADDLASVVELDPSLAAQVISYAGSAYYGYLGTIGSLRDAITRVLGFEMVMNMALGLAIGKTLSIPAQGPLGLVAYWRHAVTSAALAERLAKQLPKHLGVRPGMAYLAGLLHDFGYLLLGHVFKPGFHQLNRLLSFNPDLPVVDLETHMLGVRHDQLGAWLMRSWEMPDELTAVARWHHTEDYQGEHASYLRVVMLADRLLKPYALSDAPSSEIEPALLSSLGLQREQAMAALAAVLEAQPGLEQLAQQLAA
jgi:HD-like signal output (HDOD) protein/prolyl-tRNA editing enzyme YbaK/EbsC (Cys-tRNA(Pro) deacylase)